MPGIRIDVDTSRSIKSLADFRKSLKDTGADAKLSAWEIKQLEDRVKKNLEADKAARAADKYANSIRSMGKAAGLSAREMGDLERRLGSIRREAESTHAGSSSLSGGVTTLAGAFGRFAPQVLAVTGAYLSLSKAMETVSNFVSRGFDFNRTMETASLGIASILTATQDLVTTEGRRLQGVEKLNAAQAISRGLMKDIQVMGLQTTATTKDLVDGFQMILGPATQAGMSLDQTKKTMIGIVQAFGALGIPLEQLSAEARSLFDGDIKMGQDRLAGFLGITKELVLEWQKQGVYFDKLNEKLEAFRVAGDATAKTWTGLSSNLAESFDVIAGRSTEGLFEGAKTAVAEITGLLIDTKNLGLGQDIQNIASLIREMGDDFGSLLVSGARALVENIRDFDKWLGENRGKVESIYEKFKSIGSQLLEIVGKVFSIAEAFAQAEVATGKMNFTMGVVKASLTVINELVGYVEVAFWAVSTAITTGLLGPLAAVQRSIAAIGGTSIGSKLIDADTVAALEKYAASNEATVEGMQQRLSGVASRYKNTPFPSVKAAYNPDQTTKTRDELFREEHSQAYKDNLKSGIELEKLQGQELAKQLSLMGQIKEANSAALSVEQRRADVTQKWTEQRTKAEEAMAFAQKTGNAKLMEEATAMKNLADSGAVKAFDDIAKSAAKAGGGAAKSAQQAENLFASLNDQIVAAEAALSGDTLQTKLAQIDKKWGEWTRKVENSKLAAEEVKAALASIEKIQALETQAAQAEAAADALARMSQLLSDIADASGSPDLKIKAGMMDVDAWYQQSRQAIEQATQDEAQRAELVAALDQGVALKRLEVTRDAYESMSAVSQKYWDAEKALIEQKLSVVKENADDELAYKISAAQEWDDFNRRKLEAKANAPRSQGEAIQAVFALDSGSYKSQMGQLQDSWKSTADGMLNLTDDLSSGIAQSLGDALRGIAQGDFESFETIFRSMLLRMADAFISFSEDMLAQALKGGLSSLFQGGGSTAGTAQAGGQGGGIASVLTGLVGNIATHSFSSLFNSSSSSEITPAMEMTGGGDVAGAPWANAATGIVGGAIAGAMAGSVVPVIGTLVGAGLGLLGGLLTQEEEKEQAPSEAWRGSSIMFSGGNFSGWNETKMSDGTSRYDPADPMEMEEERKRFKSTVKDLNDSMRTLEIDFAPNWERNFSFQAMGVPDALKGILERNMKDSAAAQAMGNVSWTANLFKEGLESLDETVRRLATAFGTVQPLIGPLGIDFEKMGGVTEGVLLAFASMATGFSSGAGIVTTAMLDGAESAEELAERFAAAGESGQVVLNYLEQYRKQISNMILASYSEQLIDAVGGEDAFQQAMTVFSNYAMGDKERATASVNYSRSQFQEGLSSITTLLPNFNQDWIGDNTDAFWAAYAAAMGESMPPSVFDEWAAIAQHVANLEDSLQDLADIEFAEWAWDEELKYRRQVASEQTTGAEITRWSITMEQELADARKNGASYAQQAALVETQIYEMQAKLAKLQGTEIEPQDMESVVDRLGDAVSRQVSVLQELASEASAAATAFESLGESLRDTIEGLSDDISNPMEDFLKYRASFNEQFSLAMKDFDADSQEAMGELSGIAEDMLDAAKKSVSYEEYRILQARTVSRLGKAATRAELQGEYGAVASDLYTTESGLLSRVQEDLSSGAPDAVFVAQANELFEKLSLVSDAAKSVAEGGMSESAFAAMAKKTETDILSDGNIKKLLAGTLDLGNIDQNQARMLLSSVDALESLEKYTGHDVDLADKMRLQLETIAAGVTDQSQWSALVEQIESGQDEYISWLKTNIEERRKEADRLYALSEGEADSSEQMSAYFKAVSQYLLKQTSIETLSKQITSLNSQSASLSALANQAAIQRNLQAFNQYMQQVQQINNQVSALERQLNYWLNLQVDIPEFATGGIVAQRTLATIGEEGPEAVVPLNQFFVAMDDVREEIVELRKENKELQKQIADNTEALVHYAHVQLNETRRPRLEPVEAA